MATSAAQISHLLEKMISVDKDFRFMATNDLMAELQKDSIKLDDETERRITKALLKLLDDKNGEVQNLAVKCLGPLIAKAKPIQIELVVESLCQNIESDQERLRDVSSIALKSVVNELSLIQHAKQINAIIGKILPKLLNGLKEERRTDSSIKIEIADILGIVVDKFGRQSEIDFSPVEDVLFLLIGRERQALRKRAITVLGYLVASVQDDAYQRILARILNGLKTEKDPGALRTYVLAAATISKASTRLFVEHLKEFIDLLVSFCKTTDDDELKDACVHAFEVFIVRCNKEITPHLPVIVQICTEMVKYDPNYSYDEDENEDAVNGEPMDVDDDEAEDEDFDEYSDDDDVSWKARRSAAKCLEALIAHKSDRLLEHYSSIAPLLLSRFKEREESVKIDVFRAYEALLKQTRLFLPESLTHLDSAMFNAAFNPDGNKSVMFSSATLQKIFAEEIDEQQRSILQSLSAQVPRIVRAVSKQLKSKSSTIRLQCFSILTALVRALPGALNDHFETLIPAIKASILEKAADSTTKIDTLHFLNLCFSSHEPAIFYSHLDALIPLIANCANEPFYKVGSVALSVLQSLIIILKSMGSSTDCSKYIEQIHNVVVAKLKLNDIDQEVKERAIASTGILLSTFGTLISHHLPAILPLLLDRLRNEMTRQITVQAFCVIVASESQVNLAPIMNDLLSLLAEFLRKNQRALRVSTLSLLSSLITKYKASQLPVDGIERVVRELPTIIAEQDMYVSQLSLKLAKEVVIAFPQAVSDSLSGIITACVSLINSSLLVGRLLDFAVELFVAIVQSSVPKKPQFTDLMTELSSPVYQSDKASKQVCQAVAFIMAHSAKANNDSATTTKLLQSLVDLLKKPQKNDSLQVFALYALGEIGRVYPKAFEIVKIGPETIAMGFFNSAVEETKTVASYALGCLASGNLPKYLPVILQQIKADQKRQYLLLHALKEVISSQNADAQLSDVFRSVIDEIWAVLLSHAKAPEESTRNVVAECMGKLCKIDPMKFLPHLIELSQRGDSLERGTAATAVRFMIVDSSSRVADDYLHEKLGQLLRAIDDEDLNVRRTTIMTLNSAAHNKPRWVKELLPTLLPSLYRETVTKKELVYEIQMGPFTQIVDDGLDLRKSAYECMYTLMEHCLDRIDILEYMNYVEQGLKDQHDIALLNLLMLTRLAQSSPAQMAQRIDGFADLIMPLLQSKAKPNSVKQESDKIDELKRSCIRTILSLKRVPALERSHKLTETYEFIAADAVLSPMIKDVISDVK